MSDTELLTDQQIAEIEARAKAATKEPWIAELRSWPIGDTGDYEPCADVLAVHGDVAKPRAIGMFHELSADVNAQAANCAFTAHARADIPALIATVKQLREQKAQAQEDAADAISKANQKADELQHETQRAFRFKQERDDLQSQLEQLRAELAQSYADNERLALVLQGIEERETTKQGPETQPRAGNPWTGNEP